MATGSDDKDKKGKIEINDITQEGEKQPEAGTDELSEESLDSVSGGRAKRPITSRAAGKGGSCACIPPPTMAPTASVSPLEE